MAQNQNQGTFKVTAKDPATVVPGNHYVGLVCASCATRFAIFDVAGHGKVQFEGGGHLLVKCPHCGTERMYGTQETVTFTA